MDIERLKNYDKEHCWQYDIRLKNLEEDLKKCEELGRKVALAIKSQVVE